MGSWNNGTNGNGVMGPRVVSYGMADATYQYLMRMLDLGIIEGPLGKQGLAPNLQPIIEALHVVLSGGEVKIEVTHRGNPDIVNELNRRLATANESSNEINEKAGYYVTAT